MMIVRHSIDKRLYHPPPSPQKTSGPPSFSAHDTGDRQEGGARGISERKLGTIPKKKKKAKNEQINKETSKNIFLT